MLAILIFLLSYISIHAPRAGGDEAPEELRQQVIISIHAPRAGGDERRRESYPHKTHFNPRPPCGGRRGDVEQPLTDRISIHAPRAGGDGIGPEDVPLQQFQSTPPVRGATRNPGADNRAGLDFNPRPPCGGRQQKYTEFSVHFWQMIQSISHMNLSAKLIQRKSGKQVSRNVKSRCEQAKDLMITSGSHHQTIRTPSGSYAVFAPKCSILFL